MRTGSRFRSERSSRKQQSGQTRDNYRLSIAFVGVCEPDQTRSVLSTANNPIQPYDLNLGSPSPDPLGGKRRTGRGRPWNPGAATTAHADCGTGPAFALGFGKAPRLLPTLHPTESLDCGGDGREYDYTVKGYFKVADRTVARLPSFAGHADANIERLPLNVKRSTRHTIRAAAKRRGARRTTLTLVYRLTRTNPVAGDPNPLVQTYSTDAFLTIPRN